MEKAVIILSGGQDSTTCAFWAKHHAQFDELHCITFDYGQNHAIELKSAEVIAKLVGAVTHEVIKIPAGVLASTSPLTNAGKDLETYESFEQMDTIIGDRVEKTFVPMRNALFLTIAANRAVALGAKWLVTGVCQQDNANYPDCRQSFIAATQLYVNEALGFGHVADEIQVNAPLLKLTKAQSIELARNTADGDGYYALAFTHTAYDGTYPPVSKDHASVLRAQGFIEAGLPDPLVVRANMEGYMELPITPNYSDPVGIAQVRGGISRLAASVDFYHGQDFHRV